MLALAATAVVAFVAGAVAMFFTMRWVAITAARKTYLRTTPPR